jgi:hypothetical protein
MLFPKTLQSVTPSPLVAVSSGVDRFLLGGGGQVIAMAVPKEIIYLKITLIFFSLSLYMVQYYKIRILNAENESCPIKMLIFPPICLPLVSAVPGGRTNRPLPSYAPGYADCKLKNLQNMSVSCK